MKKVRCDNPLSSVSSDDLAKDSQRFHLLLAQSPLGVIEWSRDFQITRWSPSAEKVLGWRAEEVVGKTLSYLDAVHPDDRPQVNAVKEELLSGTVRTNTSKNRNIRKDRQVIDCQWYNSAIYNAKGQLATILSMVLDVTEQHHAEIALQRAYAEVDHQVHERTAELQQRLKCETILRTVSDAFYIVDCNGSLLEANDAFCSLVGYTRPQLSQISFQTWDIQCSTATLLASCEHEKTFETRFRCANGTLIDVEVIGRRASLDNKQVLFFSARDIAERKILEKNLRSSIELRDEFIAVASHEFKDALATLNLRVQMLQRLAARNPMTSQIQFDFLGQGALESVRLLNSLVDDLLDLTRIRMGELSLTPQRMDLRQHLLEVVGDLQAEARRHGSIIEVYATHPLWGWWDPPRIHQVLGNLLSNAIKYGMSRPIEVSLSVDRWAQVARLSVKDYGLGISPECKDEIFEPYQRVGRGEDMSGLGLGLYLVRHIVEAHGGRIQVQSSLGRGSRFVVEFPLPSAFATWLKQ